MSPASATVASGADQLFTAIGHYSDNTTAPLPLVTWSSSAGGVASVDVEIGLAHCVAQGEPVTITATDPTTGLSGTAVLTVAAPELRSIAVSPGTASIPAGYGQQFTLTGRFSDGTTQTLSTGGTWSTSDASIATVDGSGLALGVAPGGPVTITAAFGGLSSTASLTVTTPAATAPVNAPFAGGSIDASGVARFRVTGLQPSLEHLVGLTPADKAISVEVHQDASFTAIVCSSWAGGPPCRAGFSSPAGELFVLVSGPVGATFALNAWELPVLVQGVAATGSIDTETYYKVEGLTPAALFDVTLGGSTLDLFADVFAYDGPRGPFGSGLLCSTVSVSGIPKSCLGTVPATGVVYFTVEAWLTAVGTDFSLSVATP